MPLGYPARSPRWISGHSPRWILGSLEAGRNSSPAACHHQTPVLPSTPILSTPEAAPSLRSPLGNPRGASGGAGRGVRKALGAETRPGGGEEDSGGEEDAAGRGSSPEQGPPRLLGTLPVRRRSPPAPRGLRAPFLPLPFLPHHLPPPAGFSPAHGAAPLGTEGTAQSRAKPSRAAPCQAGHRNPAPRSTGTGRAEPCRATPSRAEPRSPSPRSPR